jgi:hypothetical protein
MVAAVRVLLLCPRLHNGGGVMDDGALALLSCSPCEQRQWQGGMDDSVMLLPCSLPV